MSKLLPGPPHSSCTQAVVCSLDRTLSGFRFGGVEQESLEDFFEIPHIACMFLYVVSPRDFFSVSYGIVVHNLKTLKWGKQILPSFHVPSFFCG